MSEFKKITDTIKFNEGGLVPAIAQDKKTNEVLMMAWMNKEAVIETLSTNKVCYFSRSRNKLWRKGESSGQTQELHEMIIDCDGDTILIKVIQKGVACHTGRKNCFFKSVINGDIKINQEIIKTPEELYKND